MPGLGGVLAVGVYLERMAPDSCAAAPPTNVKLAVLGAIPEDRWPNITTWTRRLRFI